MYRNQVLYFSSIGLFWLCFVLGQKSCVLSPQVRDLGPIAPCSLSIVVLPRILRQCDAKTVPYLFNKSYHWSGTFTLITLSMFSTAYHLQVVKFILCKCLKNGCEAFDKQKCLSYTYSCVLIAEINLNIFQTTAVGFVLVFLRW